MWPVRSRCCVFLNFFLFGSSLADTELQARQAFFQKVRAGEVECSARQIRKAGKQKDQHFELCLLGKKVASPPQTAESDQAVAQEEARDAYKHMRESAEAAGLTVDALVQGLFGVVLCGV